jgi:hypothetical protein
VLAVGGNVGRHAPHSLSSTFLVSRSSLLPLPPLTGILIGYALAAMAGDAPNASIVSMCADWCKSGVSRSTGLVIHFKNNEHNPSTAVIPRSGGKTDQVSRCNVRTGVSYGLVP